MVSTLIGKRGSLVMQYKKMAIKCQNQKGFTLIELMVVVGIVGILSAVAIPNFRTYQAKSKTTEAKLALASIYTAELSFFSDYDSYAVCLNTMGYRPDGGQSSRYYTTGFKNADTNANAAVPSNAGCNGNIGVNGKYFLGTKGNSDSAVNNAQRSEAQLESIAPTQTTYTAAAVGIVEPGGTRGDRWTVTNTKLFSHPQSGY